MHLILDGRGPLHAQLTRALKIALKTGLVSRGHRLPPTRLLARELGVSRNTVLTAYEQLRAEGFVEARVGSGSFVTVPLVAEAANDPAPLTTDPQSEYAWRGRRFHDPFAQLASGAPPNARYSFRCGLPLVNLALSSAWTRALARAAAYTAPSYPDAQGLAPLREALCDYLARRRGVHATPEDVLIVSGTQQAVSLTARVLLNEGDRVALEDPHYVAVRKIFQIHGAEVVGVPVDSEGLCCDLLPQDPTRLVCVTPSHQFPTGGVLPLHRRKELLQYARRQQSWIFEDDYDGEFRFDGKPVPSLRSLDHDGRVIYVGTFSKVMFPSLRLGYIVMPAALRRDFVTAKWADDFGNPAIEQAALAQFLQSGAFERHLRRASRILQNRREALVDGLRRYGRGRLDIADARAGMHLAVWLRDMPASAAEGLIERALRKDLGLHSIEPYYFHPPIQLGLLMGYCGLSVAQINEAMPLFGECLDEAYGAQTSAK